MFLTEQAIAEQYAAALQSLREIAEAYYFQGRIDDAFHLWQDAERLIEHGEIPAAQRVEFLLHYGQFLIQRYYLANGDDDRMPAVVQRAHQQALASQNDSAIATALYLVGQALYYQALLTDGTDYTTARDYLEQSAALREKIGDGYGLAETLFYIGLTYDRAGSDERAKQHYLRAQALGEQYGNTLAVSEAMRHLTDYTDGEQRLRYALRSLEIREEMRFKRALPPAQLLVGDIYLERGELAQALDYCQQAERISAEMGLRTYLMDALLMRGEIAFQQGQRAEARDYFHKGRALADELHLARGIAQADEKLAMLADEQKS